MTQDILSLLPRVSFVDLPVKKLQEFFWTADPTTFQVIDAVSSVREQNRIPGSSKQPSAV